jgi:hypothetical protein
LEEQSKGLEPRLGRNRAVWINETARLRHRFENNRDPVMSFVPGSLTGFDSNGGLSVLPADRVELERKAAEKLRRWSGDEAIYGLVCDESDQVVDLAAGADDFFGLSRDAVMGRPIEQIYAQLRGRFGQMTGVVREIGNPFSERWFGFTSTNLQPTSLRMITFPRADASRAAPGTVTLAAIKPQPLAQARGGERAD